MDDKDYIEAIEYMNEQYKNIVKSNGNKQDKRKNKLSKLFNIKKNVLYKINKGTLHNNNKKYKHKIINDKKIVIYSCITGNYDNFLSPLIKEKCCDYVIFTNNIEKNNLNEFVSIQKIPNYIIDKNYDNTLINRYIKMHPHELFSNSYDFSIYLDGNIQCISDVSNLIFEVNKKYGIALHNHCCRNCVYEEAKILKILGKGNKKKITRQMKEYRENNFPSNYGLLEANVIVTDLHNLKSKEILDSWWDEFLRSDSYRDQLSLPYILWRKKILTSEIGTLGDNVYENPKILKIEHKK